MLQVADGATSGLLEKECHSGHHFHTYSLSSSFFRVHLLFGNEFHALGKMILQAQISASTLNLVFFVFECLHSISPALFPPVFLLWEVTRALCFTVHSIVVVVLHWPSFVCRITTICLSFSG